jgi:preprotein translocase subunit SecD
VKLSTRHWAVVSGLLLLGSGLAACGGSAGSDAGKAVTTPATARTVVTFGTATPATKPEMATIIRVLSHRLQQDGISGSTFTPTSGGNIAVSIPGSSQKAGQAIATLGSPGNLSFRPVLCYAAASTVSPGQAHPAGPLPECSASSQLTAANLGVAPDSSSANGYDGPNPVPADPQFAAYRSTLSEDDATDANVLSPSSSGSPAFNPDGTRFVLGPAGLTNQGIVSARTVQQDGQWDIDLTLSKTGSQQWDQLARAQFHALIGVQLDGEVISAPITEPTQIVFTSFDGKVQISAGLTAREAKALADNLDSGPLPVELRRGAICPPSHRLFTGQRC